MSEHKREICSTERATGLRLTYGKDSTFGLEARAKVNKVENER